MHEVGCLLPCYNQAIEDVKGTGGVGGRRWHREKGLFVGLCRENTERGEGNGQHEGRFGVSDIFTKCSFVMESKHFFFWT